MRRPEFTERNELNFERRSLVGIWNPGWRQNLRLEFFDNAEDGNPVDKQFQLRPVPRVPATDLPDEKGRAVLLLEVKGG